MRDDLSTRTLIELISTRMRRDRLANVFNKDGTAIRGSELLDIPSALKAVSAVVSASCRNVGRNYQRLITFIRAKRTNVIGCEKPIRIAIETRTKMCTIRPISMFHVLLARHMKKHESSFSQKWFLGNLDCLISQARIEIATIATSCTANRETDTSVSGLFQPLVVETTHERGEKSLPSKHILGSRDRILISSLQPLDRTTRRMKSSRIVCNCVTCWTL